MPSVHCKDTYSACFRKATQKSSITDTAFTQAYLPQEFLRARRQTERKETHTKIWIFEELTLTVTERLYYEKSPRLLGRSFTNYSMTSQKSICYLWEKEREYIKINPPTLESSAEKNPNTEMQKHTSKTEQGLNKPVPHTRTWEFEDSWITAPWAHPVLTALVLPSWACSTSLKPWDMLQRER